MLFKNYLFNVFCVYIIVQYPRYTPVAMEVGGCVQVSIGKQIIVKLSQNSPVLVKNPWTGLKYVHVNFISNVQFTTLRYTQCFECDTVRSHRH